MRKYALQDVLLEFKYLPLSDLSLTGEAVKATPRAELAALPAVADALADAVRKAAGYRATLLRFTGRSCACTPTPSRPSLRPAGVGEGMTS
jgi:hypothetical protein